VAQEESRGPRWARVLEEILLGLGSEAAWYSIQGEGDLDLAKGQNGWEVCLANVAVAVAVAVAVDVERVAVQGKEDKGVEGGDGGSLERERERGIVLVLAWEVYWDTPALVPVQYSVKYYQNSSSFVLLQDISLSTISFSPCPP
jgi:hypothetical protein